jgi:hypothetical protein
MIVSVRKSGGPLSTMPGHGRLALALVATMALSTPLVACSEHRPLKPSCRAGYVADWDHDDHEWECERSRSQSGGNSGTRRRH